MRKRRLSAALALILALSMSFSSFAEEVEIADDTEVVEEEESAETGEDSEDGTDEAISDEGESEDEESEDAGDTEDASEGEKSESEDGSDDVIDIDSSDEKDTTDEDADEFEESETEAETEEAEAAEIDEDESADEDAVDEEEETEAEETVEESGEEESSEGTILTVTVTTAEDGSSSYSASGTTAAGTSVAMSWSDAFDTYTEVPTVTVTDIDNEMAKERFAAAFDEDVEILDAQAVDITFTVDGAVVEPASGTKVDVVLTFAEPLDTGDAEDVTYYAVHQHEDEDAVDMEDFADIDVIEVSENSVSYSSGEFSEDGVAAAGDTSAADDESSSTPSYLSIDADNKTITVSPSDSDDDNEIQAAINYIYNNYATNINADEQTSNQSGKTVDTSSGNEDGWTIVVNSGTYSRFTVLSYLDYLTIEAADDAEVVVNVLDGSSSPATSSGGYPDVGGVSVRIADHVTLDGLTFSSSGDDSSVTSNYNWLASAVSDFVETTEKASNLVIKNCTFEGVGSEIGVMIAGATAWEIDSCTFNTFSSAISFMLDNTYTQASIADNTIENCDNAVLESYAGGSVPDGTSAYLTMTGNTITGTASSHTTVCIMNEYKNVDSLGTVTISGNTFEHANILLDCIDTTASAIYSANDIGECSWVLVTAMGHETVSDDAKKVSFVASTASGYWVLTSTEGISTADLEYIQGLIEEANKSGSTTLTIDMSQLDLTGSSLKGYLSGGVKYLKTVLNWVTTTSVTVTKEWDDEDDKDNLRPNSVTVELYQNGTATGQTATLSDDNDWTYTFDKWSEDYKGLPVHDADGTTDYSYSVVENSVENYSTDYSETGSNEEGWFWTVTNTYEPEETTTTTTTTSAATGALGIIKVDAATGARLAGATFALYNDTTGTLIGYYTTDSNGYLQTSQLTLNYTYSFVEVTAPSGYILDSTAHTVTLTSDLSSSSSSPYVLTISNTAESSVLTEERDVEAEAGAEEAGEVLGTERGAGTGDTSNLLLWILLLIAAGAGLGAAVIYFRFIPKSRRRF